MKVVILYDRIAREGTHPDQSDALVQAEAVGRALSDLGHESVEMAFSLDIKEFLKEIKEAYPQLVFNLVESVEGHGRLIHFPASILDLLDGPLHWSTCRCALRDFQQDPCEKDPGRRRRSNPSYFLQGDLKAKSIPLSGPYIIKSVWEHASVGLEEARSSL